MTWCNILLCLLLVFPELVSAQSKNYLQLREEIFIGRCGLHDQATVLAELDALERLDTNAISRNLHKYYEDLAITHWKLGKLDDVSMQDKFISYSHKALYHKSDSQTALWNLSMGYYLRNDCPNAKMYLLKYKNAARSNDGPEHENMILERCPD